MYGWAVWIAFGVGGTAVLGALLALGIRLLQGWRDLKRVRRHLLKALAALNEKSELAGEKAATAGDTVELQKSLAKLRRSLAQLSVLREALDEARATFDYVGAVLPRK